jgi:hypothetical protein
VTYWYPRLAISEIVLIVFTNYRLKEYMLTLLTTKRITV